MTDYSDFKAQIADWINREDFSDALISSFISMANEKLNQELRISRMICLVENTVTQRCGALPDNWLENDLVLIATPNVPGGWMPIRYKSRDEFFKLPDKWSINHYTIEGRTMFFGGTPDDVEGTNYQLYYYNEVPVFADDQDSW